MDTADPQPKAFWSAYPLPSIALDDPAFVRPIPRTHGWRGTGPHGFAAGRWLDHYGRSAEFAHWMNRWCEAIQRDPTLRQQVDPLDGDFTQQDAPNYSPSALIMVDSTWRLAGVHEEPDALHWNVRPGHPAAESARFRMRTDAALELSPRTPKCATTSEGPNFSWAASLSAALIPAQSGSSPVKLECAGIAGH